MPPVFPQRVVSLKDLHQPVFTTVSAGFLVYGLVLIAFRSLLLLFESIRTADPHDSNYNTGYDLFLMVIVGSGVYVLMNAVSLVHYAITGGNAILSCGTVSTIQLPYVELGPMIVVGILTVCGVIVSVFFPFCLTRILRSIRDELGSNLLSIFLALAVVTTILAVADGLQGISWLPCYSLMWPLSDFFGFLTAVALWMLLAP
jgi:hypothetical protein